MFPQHCWVLHSLRKRLAFSWGKLSAEVSPSPPGKGLPPAPPALADGGILDQAHSLVSSRQPLSAGAASHAHSSSADVCRGPSKSKADMRSLTQAFNSSHHYKAQKKRERETLCTSEKEINSTLK